MDRFLLKKVLERIQPTKEQESHERKLAAEAISRISKAVPRGCKPVLTGSVAKGTFLADSKDIDIFVLFDRLMKKEKFEAELKRIMKKAFNGISYQLSYAEHPYARFYYKGSRIDLVPAYSIKNALERLSAVDRSVLHTRYILKKMKVAQKGEVLLLKKFLKANSLYGAEIKVQGFSGYLCELLILRYGSFLKLLKAASLWDLPKKPIVIDLQKAYDAKSIRSQPIRFSSCFVSIDPTDEDRNVSAALSLANVVRFSSLAKAFLKKPSEEFFFRVPETFEQKVAKISKKNPVYQITLPKPKIVDDVLWGQIRKVLHQLAASIEKDGFKTIGSMIADDSDEKIRIAFAVKQDSLSEKMEIIGPPLEMDSHVMQFKKQHKLSRFENRKGRVYAVVSREIRSPLDSLKRFFIELQKKGKSHLAFPLNRIKMEKCFHQNK